jgi:phage host-nuclease inhibitor protein Gam
MHNRNFNAPSVHDKRVDAQLKQNMTEHQKVIACYHDEMQKLRDFLHLTVEKYDSLVESCVNEIKNLQEEINKHIALAKDRFIVSERASEDQKKAVGSLNSQINEFYLMYLKKDQMEKINSDTSEKIKESSEQHIRSFQDLQREVKILHNFLKEDLIKVKIELAQKFLQLDEKIESKFSILRMDKDAIIKEIRVYDKTIFIMEKKIENIYTLIERINKRGDQCHRQE